MYNNWRNNFLINYVRTKILKLTRYICLKRPLKTEACIGADFRLPN